MGNREFKLLGGASLIYALVFTFCLYRCTSGVTNVLWMIATVAFLIYIAVKLEKKWKTMNTFLSIVLVLLGISNAFTGDEEIIFFNYIMIILLSGINILFLYEETGHQMVLQSVVRLLKVGVRIIGNFGKPFTHAFHYMKSTKIKKSEKVRYVIIGIVSAVPVAVLVIIMLASADRVFREGFQQIFNLGSSIATMVGIIFVFVIGYMVSYAMALFLKQDVNIVASNGRKIVALPIIIVTAVVTCVYLIFSIVQVRYLFIGKGTLPYGYTYAEYAREGFFQLLFLSALNIVAVLICMELVEKNRILKIMLYPFCFCTIIMALSSAYRMKMYINEYGLTAMRIYVLWTLVLMITIIMGMVFKLIFSKMNLFKYCMVVSCLCFLILSFGHKDYFIAKYNFDKYNKMAKIERAMDYQNEEIGEDLYEYVDMEYLMELSTDAAPAMTCYEKEVKGYMKLREWQWEDLDWCYIEWEDYEQTYNHMGIRDFNFSRWYSRQCVNKMK